MGGQLHRDQRPVGRFVSAFNWRSLLLCRQHDRRRAVSGWYMEHHCKHSTARCCIQPGDSNRREATLLRSFGWDVNALARALGSANVSLAAVAAEAMGALHHAKMGLAGHAAGIDGYLAAGRRRIYLAVMPPGGLDPGRRAQLDFRLSVLSALRHLAQDLLDDGPAMAARSARGANATRLWGDAARGLARRHEERRGGLLAASAATAGGCVGGADK